MRQQSGREAGGIVLTRKAGQSVYVGRDIVLTVCEVRSGQVKLHIEAPGTTAISRADFSLASHIAKCAQKEEL